MHLFKVQYFIIISMPALWNFNDGPHFFPSYFSTRSSLKC